MEHIEPFFVSFRNFPLDHKVSCTFVGLRELKRIGQELALLSEQVCEVTIFHDAGLISFTVGKHCLDFSKIFFLWANYEEVRILALVVEVPTLRLFI